MTEVMPQNLELADEDAVTFFEDSTGIEPEQIESTENGRDERISEPFDPTLIRVESKPMTIDLLLARIRENEIDLMPSFQRKPGIWTEAAQSRLIESILIRIPLPAFYMDATDDEKWLVVDGLQRLTTLKRFVINGDLRLGGLEFLAYLDGKNYYELPRSFQRRILETQVPIFLIEKGTPSKVRFNIFKRINTGGLPLSAQEIRHALNQGKATAFLEQLANLGEFKKATFDSIRDDRMTDRECVLRFLAFAIASYEKYKIQDFDAYLNDAMSAMNKMSDQQLMELERQFRRAMTAANDLFGAYAFRKRYSKNSKRFPINKALFEAWSVNLNKLSDAELQLLKERKEALNESFTELMQDREFDSAVSQGTGDVKKVHRRFEKIEEIVRKVLS